MGIPNLRGKQDCESLFSPDDMLAYMRKVGRQPSFDPPRGVIICYRKSLMDYAEQTHTVTKVQMMTRDLFLLGETGNTIAIAGNFGTGAPTAASLLEVLIALGVKHFISIGTAGTLLKELSIGDLVLCDRSIRDEGASYHYLKPSKYAYASQEMTRAIKAVFQAQGLKYHVGPSWTIDAIFRETVAEARQYQKEGVATVEMEASALFAVSQYRGVEMGAIFTISDSLAGLVWNPQFMHQPTLTGLEILYNVAVQALQTRFAEVGVASPKLAPVAGG
ncbi:MAG: nucleoside phosphorylase [Chloroflexi bacterium]|nr:nucleoside phosphorylase [Chloroflexota bacterium]